MPEGAENMLPGGLTSPDETRTDVYLVELPDGLWNLNLVTGHADICLVDLSAAKLLLLTRWIERVVEERGSSDA